MRPNRTAQRPVPVEPALGTIEPLGREVEPATALLEERTAAADADPPAEGRAHLVAEHPRGDDDQERPEPAHVRAEHVHLIDQRAGCQRAAVHHHELAGGREHRIDRHQDEDGGDAVVGEQRRHVLTLNRNVARRSDVPTALVANTCAT